MSSMFGLSSQCDTLKSKPRILFLVPEVYAALENKGVTHMILERDENNFFEKVITVHPLAFNEQIIKLNDQHVVFEFALRRYFYPFKRGMLMPMLPFKFIAMIFKLRQIIKTEKIDIIRATDPYLMGFIAWLLSYLTKVPFCISIHADYNLVFALKPQKGFKYFLRIVSKWMPKFTLPKANLILPISDYLRRTVPKRVNPKQVKVIYHGIDFSFEPIKNLHHLFELPTDKKIISYVARLANDTYTQDILPVFEKLASHRSDFFLVMIGGGELEATVKEWLRARPHLHNCIKLVGFQPNYVARSFRYVSDISLCLMGGFSLIEAAAAATPLISFNTEWHSELIQDHITGFLIKEHDTNALIRAIEYLLDNPELAKQMGKNAREIALKRHDIKLTSLKKQQYYRELLPNQGVLNKAILPTTSQQTD